MIFFEPKTDAEQQALSAFYDVQDKYSELGAGDSEPDEVLDFICESAMLKRNVEWNMNAEKWQLFSEEEGAEEAAVELTKAARVLYDLIQERYAN